MNILRNGDFEADWSEEESHRALVFPVNDDPFEAEIGNIHTPPGWIVWYRHQEGEWSQPECRDARATDPDRMRSGEKGFLFFTFHRKHDGGLLQRVRVQPGTKLRFSAWAHAWSNNKGDPEAFPHPEDPRWSEGAGFDAVAWAEGSQPLTGEPQQDAKPNFTFWVGIDPAGGTDPLGDSVVWGKGVHIYNGFHEVPPVEAVAEAETVTVFMRSRTMWPFKHNDAYWDDASLVAVEDTPPPKERGKPRAQYQRVYVLLPPDAGKEWAQAVLEATWETEKYTIGRSADDAGIGDLDHRTIIAINPERWGAGEDGTGLEGFYRKHYPGVVFRPVSAATPEELKQLL
jgi:hypothetical protein